MKVSIKSDAQAKQVTITLSEVDFAKMKQESFYQSENKRGNRQPHWGKN